MASLKHLHKYERSKFNREIYRCVDPRCTHYTRRDLLLDKEVECFRCGSITTARQDQLHAGQNQFGVKHVTCLACSKSKLDKQIETLTAQDKSILDDLLKDAR